ncbi:MAG: efflux RND transporter periplasmic adaptor subunit [Halofilum sp. (in: g-proteobacteria)]|nr:efflux RND transporter periplasmic adaptor subunit [Halofilum sp. (in: g-proteobacteria)]
MSKLPGQRILWVVLPLAAGIAVALLLATLRSEPEADQPGELVRSVAVIEAPSVRWRPRATGFGEARPARTWRAVAEVSGRIVERHEQLESGKILPAGSVLLRIDRADYELAVRQVEAAIAARQAQLADLVVRKTSLERSLEIERRRLDVARRELERQQRLLDQGSVSQSVVDRERLAFLQQQQAVQEIENTLAQLPAERQRLEAELARERSQLQQARRDLPRTGIEAPFDLRVSSVDAEIGQYVRVGETLMQGDGVAATEVEAEVPVEQFRAILSPGLRPATGSPVQLGELLPRMGLTAEIRLRGTRGAEPMARWPARVDRISDAIDVRTRTVGVVAVVDDPYANARPPEKPPLVKGMYVQVRLCAPAREPAVVLPRASLHEGRVYVVDDDGRLAIREPDIRFRHGDFVVVGDAVRAGESVLLSDPVPAIAGMKLAPTIDSDARAALIEAAQGEYDCP